ncbi:bifunctional [glutamate--ammonia ligase]-adenylyl-L-tyrosine phosphorylase/[glutamate--ammonia-ligase] adenylyltransferase [Succinivibrio dextrinosolvens]|uniref:bifunctional [glutamate--ammonia ligase]-adenylyl-L-tyrosine phosphorylase/[glutamate--ammonia-ligase] adenylyltransferase n=1 Tax=Succinivibrio dextrinosolvens TaxID=83771 RepID=UPI00247987ED|nr:bifunctional [glutamate--ammonia ligase]-adenylyl-L-tyrosine phosphorylase/[glutamate--ammonia-ligase] adenylyltransferase [Succinivibrio dextrinosolvens]
MDFSIQPRSTDYKNLPDELKQYSDIQYERLKGKLTEEQFALLDLRPEFRFVLALSEFVSNTIYSYPKECCQLIEQGALDDPSFHIEPAPYVKEYVDDKLSDFDLKRRLRVLRRIHYMAIAWRDLCGFADINEVFEKLSSLAEAVVLRLLEVVRSQLKKVYGDAFDSDGSPLPLLVIGMGKLGGRELNFSSDIDLIFTYPMEGETSGPRVVTFREFFSKIVQRMANFLSDITSDSFCYRIDLRLRPFGDAGAIVNSFDALQVYYETQGRTWERYALVKGRILGQSEELDSYAAELTSMLRPFVYRRYLDYGAIQSLRKLKHLIESEVRRRCLNNNFKLGKGGIREIEFISQAFALMRGGRYTELREESLRKSLKNIISLDLIPREICEKLDESYVYLRRLENIIQEISDKQTQNLPDNSKDMARVVAAMNYDSEEHFRADLDEVMQFVHEEFKKVVADEEDSEEDYKNFDLWEADSDLEEMCAELEPHMVNKENTRDMAGDIITLKTSLARMPVGPVGRETLLELMPKVIYLIAKEQQSAALFKRMSGLIEKIALRTPYIQLLRDKNEVLERFIELLKDNHFASELITSHPILLDELFIPQYFTKPPSPDEFLSMLQEQLLRIDRDDLEAVMEELRLFKKIMVFRIALSDKAGKLPLMKISDALTWLAEALIKELIVIAWELNVQKYGEPEGRSVNDPGIAVIGYGKLGGIELGYKSDLDMVFLKRAGDGVTNGENGVPESIFYQRLIQRIMHLATTTTVGGILYDLDMRLRPDGDTGVLISDTDSFDLYQKGRAWTWEHQALVRARPIAGSADIIEKFNQIREEVIRAEKDDKKLKEDVVGMREKMRSHLDRSSDKLYDIKHGVGGMIDIEFISQYLLLKYAPIYPQMKLWSDNVRILEECSNLGIVDKSITDELIAAYIDIRQIYHELSLADLPRLISVSDRIPATYRVEEIWKKIFSE